MATYYRIQPAGLGIDHRSECSDGSIADGLHVFITPHETLCDSRDWIRTAYGDEIVVIEAAEHYANGDAEGNEIDPVMAQVVARIPLDTWFSWWDDLAGDDLATEKYDDEIARLARSL